MRMKIRSPHRNQKSSNSMNNLNLAHLRFYLRKNLKFGRSSGSTLETVVVRLSALDVGIQCLQSAFFPLNLLWSCYMKLGRFLSCPLPDFISWSGLFHYWGFRLRRICVTHPIHKKDTSQFYIFRLFIVCNIYLSRESRRFSVETDTIFYLFQSAFFSASLPANRGVISWNYLLPWPTYISQCVSVFSN